MKSLVQNIRGFFNRRTKIHDSKGANVERKTLAIENGAAAQRLLTNQDFALLFNLYRFELLERLEDSKEDSDRIGNGHYIAGVRDFVGFIEKTQYLGNVAEKSNSKEMV